MQPPVMRKGVALRAIAQAAITLCALAACSGSGVDEMAASTTYNASYFGIARLDHVGVVETAQAPRILGAILTLSQLGSTVTGTIALTASASDTVLSAGVTGHTTPSGIDLTVVQPLGCAITLHGPLTLDTTGELAGVLTGADCGASGTPDLQLTLGVTRQ